MAAERVHKIRHKLNPVRDYRLMDTVHYLAQGEFAPRDDGIKLTPSREAVLSDIIWEDVCRTHWPNARLARRQHCDRYNNRFELQRLIDNLLRERVAHVERRRRRHYRIVKLNHRHESCRPVGKTGDIIVASHKSRQSNEDSEVPVMKKNAASVVLANNKCDERNPRRSHRSHDRMTYPWLRRKKYKQNDCSPGPSSAVYRSAASKDRSSGYPASNLNKSKKNTEATQAFVQEQASAMLKDVTAARLRHWALSGSESKLERAVLSGQGHRLLAEAEAVPLPQHLVQLIAKCDALHAAVEKGSLLELRDLLDTDYNRNKSVTCYDEAGVGLLHKAVFYDYMDIVKWLVESFPHLVQQRDSEGRTALHYTAVCRDEAAAAALLQGAGAARGARDASGRTLAHYRAARTLLALPAADMPQPALKNPPGLAIKRHNIRIWCHECDMGRLQRVVWEGHGTRLLSEVSSQPIVKRFLEAVPYIMNTIRDIHNSVIQNDLEGLMRLTADPVSPQVLSGRDVNGMTAFHKAAGLGHCGILKYITEKYPQGIKDVDSDGRAPLHYAATVKDEQHTYNTLVELGADESVVDNPRKKNLKAATENISSKNNNNSSVSEITESLPNAMKNSSTHELISTLPELDNTDDTNINKNQNNEEDLKDNEATNEVKEKTLKEDIHEEKDIEHITEKPSKMEIMTCSDDENKTNTDIKSNENSDENSLTIEETTKLDDDVTSGVKSIEDPANKNASSNSFKEPDENDEKSDEIDHLKNSMKYTEKSSEHKNDEKNHEEIHVPKGDSINTEGKKKGDLEENNELAHLEDHTKENNDIHKVNEDKEISDAKISQAAESIVHETINGELETEKEEMYPHAEDTDYMPEERDTIGEEGNLTNGRNTQESLIEGIIRADAEQDSQDAGMTEKDASVHGEILIVDNEIDPEVTDLINNANMEMLATLVLNGEGSRLIGRRSQNAELQAFLENVPMYMQKIKRVHIAAKDGNIRDLQTALDRRKFAIARDPISPNGATPLHVATVFGKTNIIKYLGGRFPETLSAVDFEGRTALHYAAVIPDNGHYFNLLQQLGANAKDLDDNGRSAEDYLNSPYLLPYEQMFADYGVTDDVIQSMLSDKGKSHAANGHMDIPTFQTEEGRYLAKSLGDPLIKGLTEVANVKPKDPVAFLASFLHNFPEHEKPRLNTQESRTIVTSQEPEVKNDQPPPLEQMETPPAVRSAAKTAVRHQGPIDVITLDPKTEVSPDAPENAYSSVNRDEHGQSMLHFAAARTHANNALFQLLQESDVSLGYRDELYRTARDVSIQANVPENTVEIDKWVLHLAARGNSEKIMELLLQGYDHILDIVDSEGKSITEVVTHRGDTEMRNLLASIPAFEESRESLHAAVRQGDLASVRETVAAEGGRTLARSHNSFGRTALHVAVLAQQEDIVAYLAESCPELLRIGDNLERTPLHYAMGVDKIESLSRVLIRAGSKRVLKDLKGRQPSYYFMNKSDILRLKEEEEAY
ncbi:unnamed protein product, partial [Iphiclides podalirius]